MILASSFDPAPFHFLRHFLGSETLSKIDITDTWKRRLVEIVDAAEKCLSPRKRDHAISMRSVGTATEDVAMAVMLLRYRRYTVGSK